MFAFALGRTVSYSFYVASAHAVKKSSMGDIVLEQLRSPWAIVGQVLMVVLVVALGMKHWGNGVNRPGFSGGLWSPVRRSPDWCWNDGTWPRIRVG